MLAGTVVWAIVYGRELILTLSTYGDLPCLDQDVRCLSFLANWNWPCSITQFLILLYLLRLLAVWAVSGFICGISQLAKNSGQALMLCCLLLLLPAALLLLKVDSVSWLSVLKLLGVSELL